MNSQRVIRLNDYPTEEFDFVCRDYIYQFDWPGIRKAVDAEKVTFFNVTDALEPFRHLKLDENYELYCYVTREYHGLWGRVAAVRVGEPLQPVINEKGFLGYTSFEIPDGGVHPSEAMYNDGTPEGYLEAALALEFLGAIPYATYEQERGDHCVSKKPINWEQKWCSFVDLADWLPRLVYNDNEAPVLYAVWRKYENGFGASDGRDKIYLRKHSFYKGAEQYYMYRKLDPYIKSKTRHMYRTALEDDSRYSDTQRCCISSESSIMIAEQKKSEAFFEVLI